MSFRKLRRCWKEMNDSGEVWMTRNGDTKRCSKNLYTTYSSKNLRLRRSVPAFKFNIAFTMVINEKVIKKLSLPTLCERTNAQALRRTAAAVGLCENYEIRSKLEFHRNSKKFATTEDRWILAGFYEVQ